MVNMGGDHETCMPPSRGYRRVVGGLMMLWVGQVIM